MVKIYPYVDTDGHKIRLIEERSDKFLVEYEDGQRMWVLTSQVKSRFDSVNLAEWLTD